MNTLVIPVDSQKSAIPEYSMVQWQCDGGREVFWGFLFSDSTKLYEDDPFLIFFFSIFIFK